MNAVNSMIEPESMAGVGSTGLSAGQTLRQAREAAGLHIAALAVALKVPVKKLEALESDRYDQLLDVVFARALASSVCRHLKLESEDVLAKLPTAPRQALTEDTSHLNARFPSEGSVLAGVKLPVSKGTLWTVAVVLLMALLLLFWPQIQLYLPFEGLGSQTAAGESAPASPSAVSEVVSPAVTAATGLGVATPAVPAAPVVSAVAVAAEGSTSALLKPALPVDGSKPVPATASAGVPLRLLASGATWVDVTDAKGQSVLRKTMQAGESLDVSQGTLPLAVVIGRADLTQVWVKGQMLDLKLVSRDNVARFEVKP